MKSATLNLPNPEATSQEKLESPDRDQVPEDLSFESLAEGQVACNLTDPGVEVAQAQADEPASEMVEILKLYCVMTDEEVDAIVLWLISSYMMVDDFRIFPKLALISPEKRCGKTTTMEVTNSMAKAGMLLSNMSAAAVYRITAQARPTLLIDEADTFLKNGDSEINGLINSSHTKASAQVSRCVGDSHEVAIFSTWMPMVLASIGSLPDTLMDRSIVINLRRKKSHELTDEPPVDLFARNESLRRKISLWVKANRVDVRDRAVVLPDVGNDRAGDNWRPLFKVAAALGEPWVTRCDLAFQSLTDTADLELPTLLLQCIRRYFVESSCNRVTSSELVEVLTKDEEGPWKTCNNGRPISPNQVASLLRPYGIKPKTIRIGGKTPRGYDCAQLQDAFDRYLT